MHMLGKIFSRQSILLLLTSIFVFTNLIAIIPSQPVQAAGEEYFYLNADTIQGPEFTVNPISNEKDVIIFERTGTFRFERTNDSPPDDCIDNITITGSQNDTTHIGTVVTSISHGLPNTCTSTVEEGIPIGGATGIPAPDGGGGDPTGIYNYVNSITISGPDGEYLKAANGNFTKTTQFPSSCPDYITITDTSGTDFHAGTFFDRTPPPINPSQCGDTSFAVLVGTVANVDIQPAENSGGASEKECSGYGLLGWILCPLATGFLSFIEGIFNNVILVHLVVDPLNDSADAGTAEAAIYDIWNSFRVIANILFVVIFLVAVFGQGLAGFEVFSAYDFRKILPRLVIGAIGVQLSWYIVGWLIDVFNVIGAGTRALILAPVDGLQTLDFDFAAVGEIVSLFVGGAAAWIAVFKVPVSGLLLLLPSILLPIAIALILALLTILFRKMLIFLLIVISPIAFVMGILPGTDSFLKLWWETLWKALIMYPLIIAFIAAGELTAKMLVAGDESSATNQILGIIALFAPYFLIATTFRLAGTVLAGAAGGLQRIGTGVKEKVLGDPRDPNSIRARRRKEFQTKQRQSKVDFMARHRGAIPENLKSPRSVGRAIKAGWKNPAKRRIPSNVPFVGGKTVPTGPFSRVASVVGGMAAGMTARYGSNVALEVASANKESMDWSEAAAEHNAAMLMATIGATETPEGKPIPMHIQREAARHKRNSSDVMASAKQLIMWSRDPDTANGYIRPALAKLATDGVHSEELMRRAWADATNYPDVKGLHPEHNVTDLITGELIPEKTLDHVAKMDARERNGQILMKGLGHYDMLSQVARNIADTSAPISPQNTDLDRHNAAKFFNTEYDRLVRVTENDAFGIYSATMKAYIDKRAADDYAAGKDKSTSDYIGFEGKTVQNIRLMEGGKDLAYRALREMRQTDLTQSIEHPSTPDNIKAEARDELALFSDPSAGGMTDVQMIARMAGTQYTENPHGLAGRKDFLTHHEKLPVSPRPTAGAGP